MRLIVVTVNMADGREYQMDANAPSFDHMPDLEDWANRYYAGWSSIVVTALPH